MEKSKKQQSSIIAIITMMFLFAMISFVTNLAAPFGLIWGNQYSWAGMMGNMMNFLAYLFMGIPAGMMLERIGYKKTSILAMAVGFIGLAVQYLSSIVGADTAVFTVNGQPVMFNFIIYMLGAFICGFCVCMLNTVVNPMLNLLGGGGNRGNQLIQTGGSLNSLTATLTPLFVGVLIGQVTDKTAMSDVSPLLFIAMAVFAVSIVVISFATIPEPHLRKKGENKKEKMEHSPLAFRHTLLGVIAIFFYVGIEVGIPSQLTFYLANPVSEGGIGIENGAAIGGAIAAIYWMLMLVGRFSSSFISSYVSTRTQIITVASTAIILLMIAIFLPSNLQMSMPGYSAAAGFAMFEVPVKCLFIVLCGLCTSVMWGGIFNLAVEGLGKYTAAASGIFMTMVVGGGIMPLIQNLIASSAGYITSYWLVIAMLAYILYYGISGCKNVNKDIPV